MLLRNHENVQGESATKGNVCDIILSQAFEQSGRNANVRKQEKEIVVSVVLVTDQTRPERQRDRETERQRESSCKTSRVSEQPINKGGSGLTRTR